MHNLLKLTATVKILFSERYVGPFAFTGITLPREAMCIVLSKLGLDFFIFVLF